MLTDKNLRDNAPPHVAHTVLDLLVCTGMGRLRTTTLKSRVSFLSSGSVVNPKHSYFKDYASATFPIMF